MRTLVSWLVALSVYILRTSCRVKVYNDARPQLRADGVRYVYAILHGHQLAALMVAEPGLGAMVSRSADGEMIVPTMRLSGCVPVRGSSGQGSANRGGQSALRNLVQHVQAGRPACLTVDGPRGPRGRVHKGIGELSRRADAVVLATTVIPRRRWIVGKAWDRLQVPKPFTTLELHFSEPIRPRPGEALEAYRRRIHHALSALEQASDAAEFRHSERPLVRDEGTQERPAKSHAA